MDSQFTTSGYINQRLARNVTTGYYHTEYVRVFPIGHKRIEKK